MLHALLLALQHSDDAACATLERRLACMGTALTLQVRAATRTDALAASEAAVRTLERTEALWSTWRDDTEFALLQRAAAGESRVLSADLARGLADCREWVRLTDGAFDPSVGPLVELWDLRGAGRIPTDEQVARASESCGFERAWALDGERLTKRIDGARMEEGGFAKGLGLRAAVAELQRVGARGVLDLGGQFAVLDADCELEIADPRQRDVPALALAVQRGSLATSGNSERARSVDGERIGHLLDPRTGRPAPDWGSASVWCEDAGRADAFSTAAFVLGPERAFAFADSVGIELVTLEVRGGELLARASASLRGRLTPRAALRVEFVESQLPGAGAAKALGTPQTVRTE